MTKKLKRVGILGGTFDPVHNGHLILASQARSLLKLDKIIFVPAYIPPHKRRKITHIKHRLAMLRMALRGEKGFCISPFEVNRECKSYTVNTLKYFRKEMPDTRLFFLSGSDSVDQLHTWRDLDDVFRLAKFIVAKRPNFSCSRKYKQIQFLRIPALAISSSEIRNLARNKQNIKYLVPDTVEKYIIKHKLYKK